MTARALLPSPGVCAHGYVRTTSDQDGEFDGGAKAALAGLPSGIPLAVQATLTFPHSPLVNALFARGPSRARVRSARSRLPPHRV